ncbi:MAG: ABC transporter substrate-binding protein, partial [Pseudorhodoplanes sp.]
PKTYQAIVRSASEQAHTAMQARYDASNPKALRTLLGAGAQLRPFPQPVMEVCYRAANETYAEISAKNPDFKALYDSVAAFRGEQYLWWQVAEYGFDNFMIRSRQTR